MPQDARYTADELDRAHDAVWTRLTGEELARKVRRLLAIMRHAADGPQLDRVRCLTAWRVSGRRELGTRGARPLGASSSSVTLPRLSSVSLSRRAHVCARHCARR